MKFLLPLFNSFILHIPQPLWKKLRVESGKLKVKVSASPTIEMIAEGNTITINYQLSTFNCFTGRS